MFKNVMLILGFVFLCFSSIKPCFAQEVLPTVDIDVKDIESLEYGEKKEIKITLSDKKPDGAVFRIETNPPGVIKINDFTRIDDKNYSYRLETYGQSFSKGMVFIWLEKIVGEKKGLSNIARIQIGSEVLVTSSILSYNEVADALGKRIAKTYLAIQVTVENKNKNYKFLINDVLAAYDGDPTRNSARTVGIVRPVLEKGQSVGIRNISLRSLDAAGTILAGLTPFNFGRDFAKGVAAFDGPFTSAVNLVIPDLTVSQLGTLADQAYRSNLVVEKEGSKEFLIFIPIGFFKFDSKSWKAFKTRVYKGSRKQPDPLIYSKLQHDLQVFTSGSFIENAPAQLGSFSISTRPSSLNASVTSIDQPIFFTVNIQATGSFNDLITLSSEIVPNDDQNKPEVIVGTGPFAAGNSIPVEIKVKPDTPTKSYTITIKGKSANQEQSSSVTLNVIGKKETTPPAPPGDFDITVQGNQDITLKQGEDTTVILNITGDTKGVSVISLPSPQGVSIEPVTTGSNSTAMFKVKVNKKITGAKTLVFVAKRANAEKKAIVNLTVSTTPQ